MMYASRKHNFAFNNFFPFEFSVCAHPNPSAKHQRVPTHSIFIITAITLIPMAMLQMFPTVTARPAHPQNILCWTNSNFSTTTKTRPKNPPKCPKGRVPAAAFHRPEANAATQIQAL